MAAMAVSRNGTHGDGASNLQVVGRIDWTSTPFSNLSATKYFPSCTYTSMRPLA